MKSIITQRFIKCYNELKERKVIRSGRQFAMTLDYLPQSLSEILRGRRDVTIEVIRKAIEHYKLNPVYLFTGEGPYIMHEDGDTEMKVLTIVTNNNNDEQIVFVPRNAHDAYAAKLGKASFINELPTFSLPDYKYQVGTHRAFDVAGNTMEPTLFEGDKVVCSFVDPTLWEAAIKDTYVYVIVTKSELLMRRVKNNIKNNKTISLLPDNDNYLPQNIAINKIREIWYVRAKISPFLPSPNNIQSATIRNEMAEIKKMLADQSELLQDIQETIDDGSSGEDILGQDFTFGK